MTGNTFGRIFKITTAGESYSGAFRKDKDIDPRLYGGLVTIVDGVPAGIKLTYEDIQHELDKRRPGQSDIDTKRAERDRVFILSGVMEDDHTTGAPVALYIPNTDIEDEQIEKHRSYKHKVRPGQAAYTYLKKYGDYADWYGAGRASGRETAARVAAGAIAGMILKRLGIDVIAFIREIYTVSTGDISYDLAVRNYRKNLVNCPDLLAAERMIDEIRKAKDEGDTLGGVIEVIAKNVPAGIGEPVFDKLQAMLSHALLSIGAVKGIEFGAGFSFTKMKGSQANDTPYFKDSNSRVCFETNNAGGILGGISNGEEIRMKLAVKPTPTIQKEQRTVDTNEHKNIKVSYTTRNDPCICPRIYPVCEAMTRIVLVDAIMMANGYGSLVRAGDKWNLV